MRTFSNRIDRLFTKRYMEATILLHYHIYNLFLPSCIREMSSLRMKESRVFLADGQAVF